MEPLHQLLQQPADNEATLRQAALVVARASETLQSSLHLTPADLRCISVEGDTITTLVRHPIIAARVQQGQIELCQAVTTNLHRISTRLPAIHHLRTRVTERL